LGTLLSEPLTHLIMRADGVDQEGLMTVLNAMAEKLKNSKGKRALPRDTDPSRIDRTKFRRGIGIILLNSRNEIFVGRRSDMKGNAWQLPQGGIDARETPRRAALRELKEEIGTDRVAIIAESKDWFYYDLPPAIAKKAWGGRWKGQRQKWFVMRLAGPESEIDVATAHPEFDRWRWVALRRLPALAVSFKRQLYLSLVGEFGGLVGGKP
jgi:putative (di)nucleoside polyphosphate hydrolase